KSSAILALLHVIWRATEALDDPRGGPCLRYRGPPCEADGNMRRILRAIALLITCGATVPIATAGTVLASFLFLPLPAVLPKPKAVIQSKPTHVHLLDGTEIAVFKDVEQVYPVNQQDIPE